MKTIRCDRCGEIIPYVPPYVNIATKGIVHPDIMVTVFDSRNNNLVEVDLCEKCKSAVYNFVYNIEPAKKATEKKYDE